MGIFRKKTVRSTEERIGEYKKLGRYFRCKKGLEIGGPSGVFEPAGYLPVYRWAKSLDGVNFSGSTVWTSTVDQAEGFRIDGKRTGKFYIADATDLSALPDRHYEFILSSNNIEHIANPLKAIEQWLSKLKKGGVLVIVAPRKESNFDHKRPVTPFEHLLEDYRNAMTEDDLTHLDEILALHDLALDPGAGDFEQFKARSLRNIENRCLHQHIFDAGTLESICNHFGLKIVRTAQRHLDYTVIAQKKRS